MITEQDILNSGYKHVGSSANGGSKMYQLNKQSMHVIRFHGDNFVYKKQNDARLSLIEVQTFSKETGFVTVYSEHPDTIHDLLFEIKLLNL